MLSQVTERTIHSGVEGGDLTKTVITIGEEEGEQEQGAGGEKVARAVSVQRRGSRSKGETHTGIR